jgi:hypothetical protein
MLWKFNFIVIRVPNSTTEFEREIENKNNLWKWTIVDQERHLALEIPTSRTAHTERERETPLQTISR